MSRVLQSRRRAARSFFEPATKKESTSEILSRDGCEGRPPGRLLGANTLTQHSIDLRLARRFSVKPIGWDRPAWASSHYPSRQASSRRPNNEVARRTRRRRKLAGRNFATLRYLDDASGRGEAQLRAKGPHDDDDDCAAKMLIMLAASLSSVS